MSQLQLKIYNTPQRKVVPFVPLEPGKASVYVCGPTVYGQPHVGNARAMVVFDLLVRVLKLLGAVRYVRNITDVDDKILNRATQLQVSAVDLAEKNTEHFRLCMEFLHCLPPTLEPKATQHITEMLQLIENLEANGLTYTSEGNVVFAVDKFSAYGHLTNQQDEQRLAGARVQASFAKRNPADFVVWKPAKPGEGWASKWGYGRPGWHLECSAMSNKYLGNQFDIHGGGVDLIFPHHENEIAQTQACTNVCPARYWVHSEMLLFGASKMAKSVGNLVTVIDNYTDYSGDGDVLRLMFLLHHYRKTLHYSREALQFAQRKLNFWRQKVAGVQATSLPEPFVAALLNDLDSGAALQHLDNLADSSSKADHRKLLAAIQFIGLSPQQPKLSASFCLDVAGKNDDPLLQQWTNKVVQANANQDYELVSFWAELVFRRNLLTKVVVNDEEKAAYEAKYLAQFTNKTDEIVRLIAERRTARQSKDWAQADNCRDQLYKLGLTPQDLPDQTSIWKFGN